MRLLAVALALAILCIFITGGYGSNISGGLSRSSSGNVFVNIFWGDGGFPSDIAFIRDHESEAIDVIRARLVRENKLRALPILITIDPTDELKSPRISIRERCEVTVGGYGNFQTIGECYQIRFNDLDRLRSHGDMLGMTVALSELAPHIREIDIKDPVAFRLSRSEAVQAFRRIQLHFDPVWSPDGNRLIYTVWEAGRARFVLVKLRTDETVWLDPPGGYTAARPLWSADSQYLAYASMNRVRLLNTRTGMSRTFQSKTSQPDENTDVWIWFDGTKLHFAFYSTYGIHSEVFEYDLVKETLRRSVLPTAKLPAWADRANGYEPQTGEASLRPVRSPSGSHAVLFTFVDDQRRIQVKALK